MDSNITTDAIIRATEADEGNVITNFGSYVYTYGRPIVWLVGTAGNILSFAVFSQNKFQQSLTGLLFRWLAVFDFIVVQEHIQSLFAFGGIDLFTSHTWRCRFAFWIFLSVQIMAVWTLVGIAVERLIGIVWPHQAIVLCTRKRGKIFLGVLIVLATLIMSPILMILKPVSFYEPALNRLVQYCVLTSENDILVYYITYIRPWVAFLLYSAIPFIILICINLAIVISLRRAYKMRQTMQPDMANPTAASTNMSGMTVMLITISVAFIVLTTPYCMHYILHLSSDELWAVGYVFQALNHSVNFGLYCLTGKRFRHEFVKMIVCRSA